MKRGTCVEKVRNGHNKVKVYRIKFEDGTVGEYKNKELKEMIKLGIIELTNLKLTKNGKLIEKDAWKRRVKTTEQLLEEGNMLERIADNIVISNIDIFPLGIRHIQVISDDTLGNYYKLVSKELSTNREDIKRIMFIVSKKGTVFGAVDSEDKLKYRRMISIRESIPKIETIIHNYRKQLGIEFKPMDTRGWDSDSKV